MSALKEKSDTLSEETRGKLAHPASFTLIVLVLLSRRCRETDRWVRADTCFWRSLIFKCSSCVNTNTWGNQLAACTRCEWRAAPYLPISLSVPPCHVVRVLFSQCQMHCHVCQMIMNPPDRQVEAGWKDGGGIKIVDAKCLFAFGFLVRQITIKNVFSANTFPRPPLFSPICLCSAFTSLNAIAASLYQLTLFHWHGVCFTVSTPLCSARLSFHFVSQSLLCFSLKQKGE